MWYDVATDAVADHDRWHAQEHMPERLALPGFLRGSRWVATGAGPRYFVMYEVAEVASLASPRYLERLNDPTPWTAQIMRSFQGMSRGFCQIEATSGDWLASFACSVRFASLADRDHEVRARLPGLASRHGVAGVHLLRPVARPPMTDEQRLRGADGEVGWVVLIMGPTADVVGAAGEQLRGPGATRACYRLDQSSISP